MSANFRRFFILLAVSCGLYFAAERPLMAVVNMPLINLSNATPAQWEALFAQAAPLALTQRIAFWADFAAVGALYVADPLGEGPEAQLDDDPLCDFAHVDCVTYLEQVLALANASDNLQFNTKLQSIRYRDSQIAYRWRNHYFVSDWLPNNSWLLQDITETVGGDNCQQMTKTISRARFFAEKGLPDCQDIADETATTSYIPRDKIARIIPELRTGDVVIMVINKPGIFAGHVGLIRNTAPEISLQHASSRGGKVLLQPLLEYLKTAPDYIVGCKFARLR